MRPNNVNDPYLGQLTWHQYVWNGTSTMADGTPFTLCVQPLAYETQIPPFDDATYDRTITQQAQESLARVRHSDSVLRAAISKEFWPLYANWNEGERISEADFMRRLTLESIEVLPNGGALAYLQDDDMFGGHALIAHLDPDGVVRYVEMFGQGR